MLRLLPALLLFCSCTWFEGDSTVLVTSTPGGAEILVDGQLTGNTTPHLIQLGGMTGDDHEITVRKRGYEPESRTVYHYSTGYTSRWIDGATEPQIWAFPIFWTMGDFLAPFGIRWHYVPHELHVRLYPIGQAPQHKDSTTN
jgi:hypothetical protein